MPFSVPLALQTYPMDFGLENPIEMGSDSGDNCCTACLVVGKAVELAELVGIPSFDLELQVKSYFTAFPVVVFPGGVTYLESYLAACLVPAFPITCWDCVACWERYLVACLVTVSPVSCHGLEPSVPNLLASCCSCSAGGLYFLGAACQVGGQYVLDAFAVAAVVCAAVVCAAVVCAAVVCAVVVLTASKLHTTR